jgi:hypothetical protein
MYLRLSEIACAEITSRGQLLNAISVVVNDTTDSKSKLLLLLDDFERK